MLIVSEYIHRLTDDSRVEIGRVFHHQCVDKQSQHSQHSEFHSDFHYQAALEQEKSLYLSLCCVDVACVQSLG